MEIFASVALTVIVLASVGVLSAWFAWRAKAYRRMSTLRFHGNAHDSHFIIHQGE